MNEEEFRADVLAAAASRAEVSGCGLREAFVDEVAERLREAGEIPDFESCPEALVGQNRRRLEIDAFGFDDADDSLHLFIAIQDGSDSTSAALTPSEARETGFNRLLGLFEQARSGWLTRNIEESRPLWQLARRIERDGRPAALRLHVLSDRPPSGKRGTIKGETTIEGIPVDFQIWDLSRLKRIHDSRTARDDLVVDFTAMPGGGLPVLRAAVDGAGYDGYLAAIPAALLADIYIQHGSRLLEGNVRTFLGRRGNVNKGIAQTLAKDPTRFFAYNNGIAATAAEIVVATRGDGVLVLTSAKDLQIVNGAQTTASLATARREKQAALEGVFVPMKLSVVEPELGAMMVPLISRYANSQNAVRASDFFANHPFHRQIEQISRRLMAPAVGSSQVQTHWYYERARGQHLNDQAGLSPAKKQQFLRINPKQQVITKTDLAKVEQAFDQLPDIVCKGAEKSFVAFADRITADWRDDGKRALYGDDWFRDAVARVILFRTTEQIVSRAAWYEGGYRAQIVAYAAARLAALAEKRSEGGRLDFSRVWAAQAVPEPLMRQVDAIAEAMAQVLRNPPQAGQNISEWAKQQACRKRALETEVDVVSGFDGFVAGRDEVRTAKRDRRDEGRIDEGLARVTEVIGLGAPFWQAVERFAMGRRLATPDDLKALHPARNIPRMVPEPWQAGQVIELLRRCREHGFED
jgi:hypothetical protein